MEIHMNIPQGLNDNFVEISNSQHNLYKEHKHNNSLPKRKKIDMTMLFW